MKIYTRSFSFGVLAIPETEGGNYIDSVHQIREDKFGIEAPIIENAHRTGVSRGDEPRQVT